MNAPTLLPLIDIQSQQDHRNLPIQAVGIKSVRYPVCLRGPSGDAHSVASWTMTVGLPAHVKGTHMSRFIELLEASRAPMTLQGLADMTQDMLRRLDATTGRLELRFPYFVRKAAPVSGVESLLDLEAGWRCEINAPGAAPVLGLWATVAATSLCPCSKEISAYGAHNQRSHITMDVSLAQPMDLEDLVHIAEHSASCAVYGLLKRVDEKHVTERAYENPKFVEDLVRDVALALSADRRVSRYDIEVENFESIHNHSAFARIGGHRVDRTT